MWDNGVKVKKIKGVSENKTVFEARLDKGNRILFTLGKDENNSAQVVLVYIWGIVSHDDISIKSNAIIPNNAPFLKLIPYEEFNLDLFEIDNLDKKDFTQEYITSKIDEISGSQKWHHLRDIDWERITLFVKDDFDLYLFLTPEQLDVLKSAPPILLSGTAGSGKTTIGVYYLLKESIGNFNKLFITYNKFLKTEANRLYSALLNSDISAPNYKSPDFYTYRDFCLYVASKFNRNYPLDKEINYERFTELIKQNRNAYKYDVPLIWEEIRSIIKGAIAQLNVNLFKSSITKIKNSKFDDTSINILLSRFIAFSNLEVAGKIEHFINRFFKIKFPDFIKNFHILIIEQPDRFISVLESIIDLLDKQKELTKKRYLSLLEYETMGKKKAPNFNYDRKELYKIFEWYQQKLDSEHLWDELDLTKDVISIFNEKDITNFQYDLVVCDEIQDLTDIQHELLFYVVKNPLNLILAGDTKQIINPSGFRWEELRRHFYERNLKAPALSFLSLNFRSSGSIVDLANSLLDIKSSLLGSSAEQLKEDYKFKNRLPIVVYGIEQSTITEYFKQTSAGKTVLVRTEDEKSKLKKEFGTELIFTINEAKGLEFDTVLLWNFCNDKQTTDIWENIFDNKNIKVHEAKIKHEINLLYVAITRAQKDLLIYEGFKPSVIWENPIIGSKVFKSNDIEYFTNIWDVISTPEEWIEQGDYYFDREYYIAAAECYKNGGADDKHDLSMAYNYKNKMEYSNAAYLFEKISMLEEAAYCYEISLDFIKALELYKLLKNKLKIEELQIKILIEEKKYKEVAEIYVNKKDYAKALEMYALAKDYFNAATIAKKLKRFEDVVTYLELAGDIKEAIKIAAKYEYYLKAGQLCEKIHDNKKAILYYKRDKDSTNLINAYKRQNNFKVLAKHYIETDNIVDFSKIVKFKLERKEVSKIANDLYAKKNYSFAIVAFEALKENIMVAICLEMMGRYTEAGDLYFSIEDYFSASRDYEKAGLYERAYVSYLTDQAIFSFTQQKAISCFNKMTLQEKEISYKFFVKREKYESAAFTAKLLGDKLNAGIYYVKSDDLNTAIEIWSDNPDFQTLYSIARYLSKINMNHIFAKVINKIDEKMFLTYDNEGFSDIVDQMTDAILEANNIYDVLMWIKRLDLADSKFKYSQTIIFYCSYFSIFNEVYQYIRKRIAGKPGNSKILVNSIDDTLNTSSSKKQNELKFMQILLKNNQALIEKATSSFRIKKINYQLLFYTSRRKEAFQFLQKTEKPQKCLDIIKLYNDTELSNVYFEFIGMPKLKEEYEINAKTPEMKKFVRQLLKIANEKEEEVPQNKILTQRQIELKHEEEIKKKILKKNKDITPLFPDEE